MDSSDLRVAIFSGDDPLAEVTASGHGTDADAGEYLQEAGAEGGKA